MARDSRTYRANKGPKGKVRSGGSMTRDPKLQRALRRETLRRMAGRWPGVGDPNGVKSWAAHQATRVKPKRARRVKPAADVG